MNYSNLVDENFDIGFVTSDAASDIFKGPDRFYLFSFQQFQIGRCWRHSVTQHIQVLTKRRRCADNGIIRRSTAFAHTVIHKRHQRLDTILLHHGEVTQRSFALQLYGRHRFLQVACR